MFKFQILYDDETGRGVASEDFKNKPSAQRRMRELRKQGKKNVQLWYTASNAISSLLKL
jgi:hypothetical protein